MNQISLRITVCIVFLLGAFAVGSSLLLGPPHQELDKLRVRADAARLELDTRNREIQNLQAKADPGGTTRRVMQSFLAAGTEGELPKKILQIARKNRVELDSLEFQPASFVKGDRQETAQKQAFQPGEQLPELDDQGMPVGSMQESTETEWAGMEIQPVKITILGTFRRVGAFLAGLEKELPLFSPRRCLLSLDADGLVRGQMTLVFPLLGGSPPPSVVVQGRAGL